MRHDLRNIRRWSVAATIGYIVAAAVTGLITLWELWGYGELSPDGLSPFPDGTVPLDQLPFGDMALMAGGLWSLATLVVNGVWIYRASSNARELEPDPRRISPGWAVGWFFVPFANLWMPYRAIKQIWLSTFRPGDIFAKAPGFFWLWWLAWIVESMLQNASLRIYLRSDSYSDYIRTLWLDALSAPVGIVGALFFLRIVVKISEAQISRTAAATVFE